MAKTTTEHWKELCDFAEMYVPGWYDMGLFIADAIILALKREKQQWWELYLQAEELGW